MFSGCEKESVTNSTKSSVLPYSLNDIDVTTQEMADFHYYTMSLFLKELYPNLNTLDETSLNIIKSFIEKEMGNYAFKNLSPTESQIEQSLNLISLDFFSQINSIIKNNYTINVSHFQNNELEEYLSTLNFTILTAKFNLIDNIVLSLIDSSDSYEDFYQMYNNYVSGILQDIRDKNTHDEYFYSKLFADTYVSSIHYLSDYYEVGEKGPRWDRFKGMVKEAWQQVKPIVESDAFGAVIGAMEGSLAGPPGIVTVGMTGACMASGCAAISVYNN